MSACDKFIYTEILVAKDDEAAATPPRSGAQLKQDTRLVNLLRNAVEAASDDSGWSNLAPVGSTIAKQAPEFDPRNYGYKKLSDLIAASDLFEVEKRKTGEGTSTFLRTKGKGAAVRKSKS